MLILPRRLDQHIGQGEAGAGMDIAEGLVGLAASVGLLRDEDLAGEQARAAPAALAAAAGRRGVESGAVERCQQRFRGGDGDRVLLIVKYALGE